MLKKGQLPIFITIITFLVIFSFVFASKKDYEFLMYVGVIVVFLILILASNRKIYYPNSVLWGLTAWSVLHMAGGGIYIHGQKLYALMILPIIGEPYQIFKFDQFVHIVGFLVATLVIFYVLKPILKEDLNKWIALSIVVIMAGLGLGALNEIVEFIATVLVPNTGVGGYENTALDLVSDLIGAIIAMIYLRIYEGENIKKINN